MLKRFSKTRILMLMACLAAGVCVKSQRPPDFTSSVDTASWVKGHAEAKADAAAPPVLSLIALPSQALIATTPQLLMSQPKHQRGDMQLSTSTVDQREKMHLAEVQNALDALHVPAASKPMSAEELDLKAKAMELQKANDLERVDPATAQLLAAQTAAEQAELATKGVSQISSTISQKI